MMMYSNSISTTEWEIHGTKDPQGRRVQQSPRLLKGGRYHPSINNAKGMVRVNKEGFKGQWYPVGAVTLSYG